MSNAEPTWEHSTTFPTELWKNRLIPISDRLEIADGAISDRDEIIANLRRSLSEAHASQTTNPVWLGLTPADWNQIAYTYDFYEGAQFAERTLKARNSERLFPVAVQYETESKMVTGSTGARVKRVEWQDDGTLCVTIDGWPVDR